MKESHRSVLPAGPLLGAYVAAGVPTGEALAAIPVYGQRVRAVLDARDGLLSEAFLESAGEDALQAALVNYYEATVRPALQTETVRRRAGFLRHALAHLVRSGEPLGRKTGRFLDASGPYRVAGLGPVFWSACFQGREPAEHPGFTTAIVQGVRCLGLARWSATAGPAEIYTALQGVYRQLLGEWPGLSALHLDHFFSLAALMQGRNLWSGQLRLGHAVPTLDLAAVLRRQRARLPLRKLLKERGRQLQEARRLLEAGLQAQDGVAIGSALAAADPAGAGACRVDWPSQGQTLTLWVGRLWEAADPEPLLAAFWQADPIPGAGLWLPAAVLHLRDPDAFHPWNDGARQGYGVLADDAELSGPPAERYRLFNEGVGRLREGQRLHPLEVPAFLAGIAAAGAEGESASVPAFGGFCPDTFAFLAELADNNRREWMLPQRQRYRFAVRDPLVELCLALAERYVRPVLHDRWGWELETTARPGKALTSIVKNDYGRSVPYQTALWITFCRRGPGRRHDAQLFVRVDAGGVSFGLRLGREAREAGRLLRTNVQEHAELLYRALSASGALSTCRFAVGDDRGAARSIASAGDLRAWAAGKTLLADVSLGPDSPLLSSDELAGQILLTFDRLLPAYVCAVSDAPAGWLARRAGQLDAGAVFTDGDFCRDTSLPASWLERARSLLELKRQLILQGVPGTGKTFVAQRLARLLAGRSENVRLVQFHPAYGYEEFVEGIKVRSVEVGGRHEITYPVEPGLLCAFAEQAAAAPSESFVLVIDEINRGNLPRIFGELLYLLEYRGQGLVLPYSGRGFRLPANLYLLGTMNAADRSVALIDQALRRRFSFLEMAPDTAVLAAWLASHPPRGGPEFAGRVVALLHRLNNRLARELGPASQVGHSFFMVPELDEARLEAVWEHHVLPLLSEHFASQPERLHDFALGRLLPAAGARPAESRATAG